MRAIAVLGRVLKWVAIVAAVLVVVILLVVGVVVLRAVPAGPAAGVCRPRGHPRVLGLPRSTPRRRLRRLEDVVVLQGVEGAGGVRWGEVPDPVVAAGPDDPGVLAADRALAHIFWRQ